MSNKKRAGVRNITINNVPVRFDPTSITSNLGTVVRTEIPGSGGRFTEAENDPYIQFTWLLECNEDEIAVRDLCDAVVSVEYHNGRVTTLRDATQVASDDFSGDTGSLSVKFTTDNENALSIPGNC